MTRSCPAALSRSMFSTLGLTAGSKPRRPRRPTTDLRSPCLSQNRPSVGNRYNGQDFWEDKMHFRNQLMTIVSIGMLAAASLVFGAKLTSVQPKDGWFTTSDNVKIHYLTLGDHGSWVVLIHGYTGNAKGNWFDNGIAQALAKNHRVVALDNRNHGQSDKPQLNGPGRALDTIELMDHLKIDKAHIGGYSMGGGITGQLLATNPDRFITAHFGG